MPESIGAEKSFILFGGQGERREREIFARNIHAQLAGEAMRDEGEGMPEYWRQFVQVVATRPYAELCADVPELAEKFAEGLFVALGRLTRDLGEADPGSEVAAGIDALRDSDDAALAALIEQAEPFDEPVAPRLAFYAERLEAMIAGSTVEMDASHKRAFRDKALEEIAALLARHRGEFARRFLSERADEYLAELDGKYDAIRSILARTKALSCYLGRFWDLSTGEWAVSDWSSLAVYADVLERNQALQDLAASLGRLREAEKRYDEERVAALPRRAWQPGGAGKSEIVGIRFSDDLSSLLPVEAGLLASEETELVFLKRFAEKSLLTLDYDASSRYEKPEPPTLLERRPRKDKGPIILLIDTSGSMHGTPETIAKTVSLALLKVALKEGRPCLLLSFSTGFEVMELSAKATGMRRIVDFLSRSFHGGTDLGPALQHAMGLMRERDWSGADLLVISDFVVPRPSDAILEEMNALREKSVRFCSLRIGHNAHDSALAIFDRAWSHDPEFGIAKEDVAFLRQFAMGK